MKKSQEDSGNNATKGLREGNKQKYDTNGIINRTVTTLKRSELAVCIRLVRIHLACQILINKHRSALGFSCRDCVNKTLMDLVKCRALNIPTDQGSVINKPAV